MREDQDELLKVLSEIRDEIRLRREQDEKFFKKNMEYTEGVNQEWRESKKEHSQLITARIALMFLLILISFIFGSVSHFMYPIIF